MALDPAKAYERRWWTLGVLCLSVIVTTVDNTILNVALPSIVKQLGATGSQLQWLIDAYVLVFACLLLTAGALGDRFGRKGALTAGLLVFGSFSVLASTAHSAWMLVFCRGLMGIGGALIYPTTLSILSNAFTGYERARAIGIWAALSSIGVVLGPLSGGLLLQRFWWGSVFLVNVPICVLALVLGYFYVPQSRDEERTLFDPPGALLSIVALFALLYGIIEGPDRGWSDPAVLSGFGVGVVFFAAYIAWELHTTHPMLELRFFRNPRFSAASATITLNTFALFSSTFILTQYFQFVLGYSPLKAGVVLAPNALGLVVAAPGSARLTRRYGSKLVIVAGLTIVVVAFAMFASDTIMSSLVTGSFARFIAGAGIGLAFAPATDSIMGALPRNRAGVGSAINDTTRQTGGALGIAVLGSVVAAGYHTSITHARGILPAAARAAHDSIGSAFSATKGLPSVQAVALRHAAGRAYVNGMRWAFSVAIVVELLAIAVCARFLPAHEAVTDAGDETELDIVPGRGHDDVAASAGTRSPSDRSASERSPGSSNPATGGT